MFSSAGGGKLSSRSRARTVLRAQRERVARLTVAVLLAIALYALTGSAAAYAAGPSVTGVSADSGPAAGGTTLQVTGSGFALGASATAITFAGPEEGEEEAEELEAVSVNCTTTTECTAVTPELPQEFPNVLDVRATVGAMRSPRSPADEFEYQGLFLLYNRERLAARETVILKGQDRGGQVAECNALVEASTASNGQAVVVLGIRAQSYPSCRPDEFSGELPFSFSLHLGDDGSASIEGPVGVAPRFTGCVYEGSGMTGNFELVDSSELFIAMSKTLPLVSEEEPADECQATEAVFVSVLSEHLRDEVIGAPVPQLTGLSPEAGSTGGGTSVTLTGAGFGEASAVKFGSTDAASFTINSPTSITAVSPAGEGTVGVTVTGPKGTSTVLAQDHFTYEPPEPGLPEIGRCMRVTPVMEGRHSTYHGAYTTAHCTTTSATHEGKFEWSAGPGTGGGFTGSAKSARFETTGEVDHLGPFSRIACAGSSESGEFTGPRTAVATLTFSSCVEVKSKATCQSTGEPAGTVQTGSLDGELGVIEGGEAPVLGIAFRPHGSTVLAKIECGASAISVEGGVIAQLKPIDGMSSNHTLIYKGHEGAQSPAAFEGEAPQTLSVGDPMSLKMTMALVGAEPLEVKAIG